MDYFVGGGAETIWNNEVMFIGVVIAEKDTFKKVDDLYFIFDPEYSIGGMFSMVLPVKGRTPKDLLFTRKIAMEKFKEAFEKKYWEDLFYKKENGKYQLNLWKANELIFLESGILPELMAITNVCTHCNGKILYSHRTMGHNRGNLCAFHAIK